MVYKSKSTNPPVTIADINHYYEVRGLRRPGLYQAILWLSSEVGEVCELINRADGPWTRNNKEKEKRLSDEEYLAMLGDELGDVIMMACAAGISMGLDPIDCLLKKMAEKMEGAK